VKRSIVMLCSLLWPLAAAEQASTEEERLNFLRTAAVVSSQVQEEGVTHALRATLSLRGSTHDAQIQSIDELWDANEAFDSYKHNVAAYELSRMLGLGMVPATVSREYKGRPASFTWWVDDVLMTEAQRQEQSVRPPEAAPWNRQVLLMKVFDALIRNTDRNTGNVLIDRNWKVWMIDHTRSFGTNNEILEPEGLTRCDRLLLQRLQTLQPSAVAARLSAWLTPEQIGALMTRRDLVVRHFQVLSAEKGESAVFYDYLHKE